ncbi:MAG TPA: SRPBCC family protein [Saprospiraceae bacterium]|nr:SRPBCC family protein [Saprospiraceae bacterium]
MPIIEIELEINAGIELCFDLSRSIDLHIASTSKTKEKAIDGRTSGLIELNEMITWEAIHFGIKQRLTSKITIFNNPFYFRDEQVKGAFKYFIDDHYFEQKDVTTLAKERFEYEAPFGIIGRIFSFLILTRYMKKFLTNRNLFIKKVAESEEWKSYLKQND